jgi:hypothetical protein
VLMFRMQLRKRIIFIFFPRDEGSLSCLRLTHGVIPTSTTRLYRGYVNWG